MSLSNKLSSVTNSEILDVRTLTAAAIPSSQLRYFLRILLLFARWSLISRTCGAHSIYQDQAS